MTDNKALSIFNTAFFKEGDYLRASGDVATQEATLTQFTGELDVSKSIEFDSTDVTQRFILNPQQIILCNDSKTTSSGNVNCTTNVMNYDQGGADGASGGHVFTALNAASGKTTTLNMSVTDTTFTNSTAFHVNCDTINTDQATLNLFDTTPTTINLGSASCDINIAGTLNGEDLSHISGLTGNIQTAIDDNTTDLTDDCVRKSGGTQIMSPSLTLAGGRLSAYHGALASAISSVPLLVSNSTLADTTVNGTLAGEDVYPMIQMGNRACCWANGTDNVNMYMGMAGGGGFDCDYEYTFRRGTGMKISPTFDTNTFTEALKVVGDANITASQVFGTDSSDACTINSSIYAPAAKSYMRNTAGIFLLSGTAGSYYSIPIYHSTADLINNTYEQQYTSGSTGYTSQSGSALGSWSNINLDNSQDVFIVHPNYGLIVYNDTGYTNEIMNFKNTSNGPQVVKCTTDDTATSIKVYYDDALIVGL